MNPVTEFLALKEKTANWIGDMGRALKTSLGGGTLGAYLAPAIASAGVAAAGLGVKAGYEAIREKLTKQRDYKSMVDANPALRGMDAKQVSMVYNSLRRLSPTMARDPLIAGSFVRKTIELAPESGLSIDPLTAKTIAETQKNIAQAKSSKTSVYEAMLSGLGKTMPIPEGPEVMFGIKGPSVKGRGDAAREEARRMGLPMTFSGHQKRTVEEEKRQMQQRLQTARKERMMPQWQRPLKGVAAEKELPTYADLHRTPPQPPPVVREIVEHTMRGAQPGEYTTTKKHRY